MATINGAFVSKDKVTPVEVGETMRRRSIGYTGAGVTLILAPSEEDRLEMHITNDANNQGLGFFLFSQLCSAITTAGGAIRADSYTYDPSGRIFKTYREPDRVIPNRRVEKRKRVKEKPRRIARLGETKGELY